MKFGFVAKHRGAWPVKPMCVMCEALGVLRGGFYAWLARPRSWRRLDGKKLGAQVHQSFVRSDRSYGARRVWRDVLEQGQPCGLHRIERLMREQALRAHPRRRGKPVTLLPHSEQGSQYTSAHFKQLLREQGIACSMSRAGEVWDNPAMESLFNSMKTGRTARRVYRSREQARADVSDCIEQFYNPMRRHSTLGYVSPVQFEQAQKA